MCVSFCPVSGCLGNTAFSEQFVLYFTRFLDYFRGFQAIYFTVWAMYVFTHTQDTTAQKKHQIIWYSLFLLTAIVQKNHIASTHTHTHKNTHTRTPKTVILIITQKPVSYFSLSVSHHTHVRTQSQHINNSIFIISDRNLPHLLINCCANLYVFQNFRCAA